MKKGVLILVLLVLMSSVVMADNSEYFVPTISCNRDETAKATTYVTILSDNSEHTETVADSCFSSGGFSEAIYTYCDGNQFKYENRICSGTCGDRECDPADAYFIDCTETENGITGQLANGDEVTLRNKCWFGSKTYIQEYYCVYSGRNEYSIPRLRLNMETECEFGCEDGVCLEDQTGSSCNQNDVCESGESSACSDCDFAAGWSCNHNGVCEEGEPDRECDDCVEETQEEGECFDSDGGENFYKAGYVKGHWGCPEEGNPIVTEKDYCEDGYTLMEYICNAGCDNILGHKVECPAGCKKGACLKSTDCEEYFMGVDKPYSFEGKTVKLIDVSATSVVIEVDGVSAIVSMSESREVGDVEVTVIKTFSRTEREKSTATVCLKKVSGAEKCSFSKITGTLMACEVRTKDIPEDSTYTTGKELCGTSTCVLTVTTPLNNDNVLTESVSCGQTLMGTDALSSRVIAVCCGAEEVVQPTPVEEAESEVVTPVPVVKTSISVPKKPILSRLSAFFRKTGDFFAIWK